MTAILPTQARIAAAYQAEYEACIASGIPEGRARQYAEHAARLPQATGRLHENYGNERTPMPDDHEDLFQDVRQAACAATETRDEDFEYHPGQSKVIGGLARSWAMLVLDATIGAGNTGKLFNCRGATVATALRRFRSRNPRAAADAEEFAKTLQDRRAA